MFSKKADLSFNQIKPLNHKGQPNEDYPKDRVCKSGHVAAEGAVFYDVGGDALPRRLWGKYCEFCVKVAQARARQRRSNDV